MDGLGEMAGRAPLDEAVDSPAPSTHAGRSMSPADSISRCAVVGSVPTSHESLAESASGEAHVLVKEEAAAGADELSPDDELGKQDGLSVIVQPQDESRDSELLSPGKLSPTSAISVSVASMIDAGEFRSLQPEPTYQTLTSVNGRMSPPGFSPSSSYATLTPLQPLPPISTMSDKFAYGHAGNVSGSFTVMQNNGLGNMGLGMSVGSPYMGMSPPHHYSSPGHLGGMLPQQHSPLSPQSGYSQNGLHSPQKSLSPSGYDSPYAQRPAAVAPHSPALSPPSASLHSPPGAGVGVVTAAFQPAPLGALNGLPQLAAASASPHHSPHVVPSPSPPGFAPPPQQPPPPQQQQQVVVKTVAGSSGGLAASAEVEEINTKELAQRISAELKRYSIPQAIFAQRVLCRSQGTLSDLLRNPKPWSKLKSGRETFRRMWKWLQEPEFQRMSALRLADVILRRKWKYLRDQFAVQCGKILSMTIGMGADEANLHSKWPFFKSLLFLKDIVAPRNSTGNLSAKWFKTKSHCPMNVGAFSSTGLQVEENRFTASHPQNSEIETESLETNRNEFIDDAEGGEKELNQEPVVNSSMYTPTSTKPPMKRGRSEEFNSSLLRIEEKKLEYLLKKGDQIKSLEDDADLYFFKSLIPHVK